MDGYITLMYQYGTSDLSPIHLECGRVTPGGEEYVIGGWATQRGEFPWHVGIYRKDSRPYMQICGGSIVSSTLVISAAHCFYTDAEGLQPANKYAVAAGKIYRPWDDQHDMDAQKSDVSDIKITEPFLGFQTNYQEDIALVFLSKPFEYKTFVRPVCFDFDFIFNTDQLSAGQIAGWGLTKEDGAASQILLTMNLPYIPSRKCLNESPAGFQEYIVGDQFCAGFTNVTVSPSSNSVVKNFGNECSCPDHQFRCTYSACVDGYGKCDNVTNCVDNSDELHQDCFPSSTANITKDFTCNDGTKVSSTETCDARADCPDGSDETVRVCSACRCHSIHFQCAYGACVDSGSDCNGNRDCTDGSGEADDLSNRIGTGGTPTGPTPPTPAPPPVDFTCNVGNKVSRTETCDARADCPDDGFDETVRLCGACRCHSIYCQCAYEECVDSDSDCNGNRDCADESDEADDLCNRIGTGGTPTGTTPPTPAPPPVSRGDCVLPPYPEHGCYTVEGQPQARPGQRLEAALLNITCETGYKLSDNVAPFCYGKSGWSAQLPKCIQFCRLKPHKSVKYSCIVEGTSGGTQDCPQFVPSGTRVIPACNTPNYYSRYPLRYMNCNNGEFDAIEICDPECGRVTPGGEEYVIGGWATQRGEFPWHVGIYRKDSRPYMQICGGSIVSSTLVISAAHCFYTDAEGLQPANKYAVAAGKIYRPWDDQHDTDAQKSDVSDIKITERFLGSQTNYQEDIALVFLPKPFEYNTFVRPVCLDFDLIFNTDQLSAGQVGRIAGWGLTKEDEAASQILLTVNLPYIPSRKCLNESPAGFQEYIVGDKFCAGFTNGTSLCKGDSGGGLVFGATSERGVWRYYLRGIVSTGPRNLEYTSCDSHFYTTFTEIQKHEMFIRTYYSRS